MSYLDMLHTSLYTARNELIKARSTLRENIRPSDLPELRALTSECLAELSIIKLALGGNLAMQTDRMDSP